MAAKSARIVLLTDAPLGENRYLKGTGFDVVDKRLGELREGEVDVTTAAAWKRLGWAADAKPAAKAARGGDVD